MANKKIVVVLVIACVATAFALTKKDELSQKVLCRCLESDCKEGIY